MRITESQIRRIIREEVRLLEGPYFRSPVNAPFDVTGATGRDLEPEGQRRILELFLQEHPHFEETLLARPIDRQAELMLVMRALRDVVGKADLFSVREPALRQAGQWLVNYYRNTDEYVRRRG